MHITLSINSRESRILRLPTASLHLFQSLLYNLLPADRAKFLHDEGYVIDGRPMKLFAMSWPMSEHSPKIENRRIEFTLPIRIVVSTPKTETLDGIASGAIMGDDIRVGANIVYCDGLTVDNFVVESNTIAIRTLSPITCYATMPRADGRKYTAYFSPVEKNFSESIHNNLTRKYRALFPDCQLPEGTVTIHPLNTPRERIARFKVNDTFPIKGWSGRFRLSGPKELLQVALDCGLGAKNSGGFGCITYEGA